MNSTRFTSISKKIKSIIFVTLFITVTVFIFVTTLLNLLTLDKNLEDSENEIKKNLTGKGQILVTNNSIALRGMAEDNSFSAISDLVVKTVQNDSEIQYGIFMDNESRPWIYFNGEVVQSNKLDDPVSKWAARLKRTDYKEIRKENEIIFEFAAPIFSGSEKLGTIRYGFSLKSIRQKIEDTKSYVLKRSLVEILLYVFLGFIIFVIAGIASTKRTQKIVVPLNDLTDAAERMSSGNYSEPLNVQSNDEIGVLANSFNLMKVKIQEYTEDLHSKILELNRSKKELYKKEKEYRSLYETAVIGLFRSRVHDGKLLKANKRALDMFGYPNLEDALAANFVIADHYSSEQRKEILEQLKFQDELSNVIIHFTFDGDREMIGTVSIEINREEAYLEGSILDITERIRSEEMLKKKEQQLIQAQKMETVGNLAGGLAHDFNNVLGGIVGTLSLIQVKRSKKNISLEKIDDYLEDMKKSADRATNLVKQLLTLSRKQELSLQSIDLNQIIQNVVKICKNTFDKSIEINPVYTRDPAIINADLTQVEQVLLNLAINGSHAMTIMRSKGSPWGGELKIGLKSFFADKSFCEKYPEAKEAQYWELFIQDEGIGIDDSIKNKIFDPFFTTKDKEKGTGLGLSMVYNIVLQHGGFLNVYSEGGNGTKFSLYFPKYMEEEQDGTEKKEEAVEYRYEGLAMVVDDESIMRKVASAILGEMGFEVIIAEDGEEGFQRFLENKDKLQIVILDLMMPKKSGDDCLIEMKKHNTDIRVLLASGFKKDQRLKKIANYEYVHFIEKPYSFDQLSKAVKKLMDES